MSLFMSSFPGRLIFQVLLGLVLPIAQLQAQSAHTQYLSPSLGEPMEIAGPLGPLVGRYTNGIKD